MLRVLIGISAKETNLSCHIWIRCRKGYMLVSLGLRPQSARFQEVQEKVPASRITVRSESTSLLRWPGIRPESCRPYHVRGWSSISSTRIVLSAFLGFQLLELRSPRGRTVARFSRGHGLSLARSTFRV